MTAAVIIASLAQLLLGVLVVAVLVLFAVAYAGIRRQKADASRAVSPDLDDAAQRAFDEALDRWLTSGADR